MKNHIIFLCGMRIRLIRLESTPDLLKREQAFSKYCHFFQSGSLNQMNKDKSILWGRHAAIWSFQLHVVLLHFGVSQKGACLFKKKKNQMEEQTYLTSEGPLCGVSVGTLGILLGDGVLLVALAGAVGTYPETDKNMQLRTSSKVKVQMYLSSKKMKIHWQSSL